MSPLIPRRRPRLRFLIPLIGVVLALVAGTTVVSSNAGAATSGYPDPGTVSGDVTVHDPSMVRRSDGTYVLISTAPGLAIRTSTDRVNFSYAGLVWPSGASWTDAYTGTSNGNLWAPDISYHNGKYYLYYAASSFGSNNSAIFLATSTTAMPGTWTNQGVVYSTTTSSDHNAIDPNLYVAPNGSWYLSLGSFWTGLKMIRLDAATGLRHATDTTVSSLAARPGSTALEAPQIVKHGSYYYLFMSWDSCCQGASSTYRVMVGRSKHLTSGYVDADGVALVDGGGTEVLASHGRYVGPGGQSVLTDVDGDLLVYHYYDGADSGTAKLGINLLGWDSSVWPYVY